MVIQSHDTIHMIVSATKNGRSTRCADAVRDKTRIEEHSFFGQSINVGGMVDSCAIAADGLARVIIRHDEDDVGPIIARARSGTRCLSDSHRVEALRATFRLLE